MADRQRWLCYWCQLPMLPADRLDSPLRCTADHIKRRADGGMTTAANIVAAHAGCNNGRHNGELREASERPASPLPGRRTMKFCKDCRHAVEPENGKEGSWICAHHSALFEQISPVTGELISGQITCKTARTIGECRDEAKYWEPKDDLAAGFV